MTATWRRLRGDETGGLFDSSILQLLLVLAVVGLVIAEAVALGVNAFGADDAAREVAVAASRAYASTQSVNQTRAAAEDVADELGVELVTVAVDQDFVAVEIRRQADTLVLERIDAFADMTSATARGRSRWR